MILLLLISLGGWKLPAEAAAQEEIRDADDLYEKILDQISAREMSRYYRVNDVGRADSLIHMDMPRFQAHYDESKPLKSGCYLSYYMSTVYLSYQGHSFQIRIEYPYSKEEMDAHFAKMDQLAPTLKGKTEYDTVKNVHDYLIDHFDYDTKTSMVNHTDIDGFRDGVMVCSGYSLAAYYLLNVAGVKTRIITGYGGGEDTEVADHMWNMVQVDGKWYNLDITWDDGGGTTKDYRYFLKSDAEFPMHRRLGVYAGVNFNIEVSKESYPLPFYMKFRFGDPKIWIATAVVFVLLVMVFSARRRKKTAAMYHGEVVYEEDLFEGVNERSYETWKNQIRMEQGTFQRNPNINYGSPETEQEGDNEHV